MKASEALALTLQNRCDEFELYQVLSKIRGSARQGFGKIVERGISDGVLRRLESMGYIVKLSEGRYADIISWEPEE